MEPIPRPLLDTANVKSCRLRELVRAPDILVMPGAYDVLSALLFARMGFKSIQGTSGGIAASLGYPDGEVMSRERFLEVINQDPGCEGDKHADGPVGAICAHAEKPSV